jgi:hypothetical protein
MIYFRLIRQFIDKIQKPRGAMHVRSAWWKTETTFFAALTRAAPNGGIRFTAAIQVKGVSVRTDPILLRILTEGIHTWLLGHDNGYNATAVPVKYKRLVREQNLIGWRQLFNGQMSKEWARLQADTRIQDTNATSKHIAGATE